MSHERKRILFHLPIAIAPDALNGNNGRVLGMLEYFHDRRDRFAVDAIVGNKFGMPEWSDERQQDILKFVDNIFVYRGESNWFDFIYTRTQSFYHQRLLRQQLPVDSDYFAPPGYVRFLNTLLARKNYDFVWINNLDYAHLASNLSSPDLHTIIDIHDITCRFRLVRKEIEFSKNLKFDYAVNFKREIALLDRFDSVIVDSQFEREILAKELANRKLHFIPSQVAGLINGDRLTRYRYRKFEFDLLFVGANNQPNREGLQFFITEVLPLIIARNPKVKLAIAGKISAVVAIPPALANQVICLGYVTDLAELYLKTRLVICPLRTGAGTKFKLVEAMAYGMPIVATVHSASALSLVDDVNAFITDEPAIYADRVLRLIADLDVADRFSERIRSTFTNEHSSSAIYAKLDAIFDGVKSSLITA